MGTDWHDSDFKAEDRDAREGFMCWGLGCIAKAEPAAVLLPPLSQAEHQYRPGSAISQPSTAAVARKCRGCLGLMVNAQEPEDHGVSRQSSPSTARIFPSLCPTSQSGGICLELQQEESAGQSCGPHPFHSCGFRPSCRAVSAEKRGDSAFISQAQPPSFASNLGHYFIKPQ